MSYEKRLIEGKFPCDVVGAETRRERGASSALPPLYFLHVWWARRPLTASRAAVLGSILPADTPPDDFVRMLGIKKKVCYIEGLAWTLVDKDLELIHGADSNHEYLVVDKAVHTAINRENKRRENVRKTIKDLLDKDESAKNNPDVIKWISMEKPLPDNTIDDEQIPVVEEPADPVWFNNIMKICSEQGIRVLNEYGYSRAYASSPNVNLNDKTVLDVTAGGGSIPFEALRCGCNVIANDLNPVASVIETATLDYPSRYGLELVPSLINYGKKLVTSVSEKLETYFDGAKRKEEEKKSIWGEHDNSYLYCRTVVCPHCGKRVPLLNAFALQKKADGWMVVPEFYRDEAGADRVRFRPVRLEHGKGPKGESPEQGTVKGGVGTCLFCNQTIESEEIKRQARGESDVGEWRDELYCVVAVRLEPKRDANGNVRTYKSGPKKGEPMMQKVLFFRQPVREDFDAIARAEKALRENWQRWDDMGLIPTERIPEGEKTRELLRVGITRWCDMFAPRQLLALLTAMETLRDMKRVIIDAEGKEKGKAIITYLQFMIDKLLDYNSRQTLWHAARAVIAHTFTRHDFSFKWTFGELIMSGTGSGMDWCKNQVIDAYENISALITTKNKNVKIINGSAANIDVPDKSVSALIFDPPYYNNVQYAELSDYFYVWDKRTLGELYPDFFRRNLTNKDDEAVANPARDGSTADAKRIYEEFMGEIFKEARRVLSDDGILTMMFTHKSQDAWETLTRALIENGWIISSCMPVESEDATGIHHKDVAAAQSSIFISCRKRDIVEREPKIWRGFGGTGVAAKIRDAVRDGLKEFATLKLGAVDEMVASYGRALKVLSESWPVMDGDELITPIHAMREASAVVAQYQLTKITGGRLSVADVEPEAAVALTFFGIYGMASFAYDDALSISRSLNISLETYAAGYTVRQDTIGINKSQSGDDAQYFAPLIASGSKLRLARPEERAKTRMDHPATEWDIMQGTILAYRDGDVPVARAYLERTAQGKREKIIDLLHVWAEGVGDAAAKKEAERLLFSLK